MKNKILKAAITVFAVMSMTGCTKYVKIEKQQIKYKETGQILVKNILCKTDTTEQKYNKAYNDYIEDLKSNKKISKEKQEAAIKTISKTKKDMNIKSLSKCDNMKVTGSYDGLWTTLFVRPLAWVIIKLGQLLKSYGLSLIIITIIIRLIVWPITKKTAMQSENMKKAQPELMKLEKKYQNKTDRDSLLKKTQEQTLLYKKYNISPFSSCLFALIQIPLFFAFLEAINRIPAIFEETFLGFQLGTSPFTAIFVNHEYIYIILFIILPAATYFSFKLNGASSAVSEEQQKQMKMMTNMMVVFMTITAGSISSGIAIYWIVSQIFTIIQNLLVKRSKKDVKN